MIRIGVTLRTLWPSANRNLMVRATADGYEPALLIGVTSTEGELTM